MAVAVVVVLEAVDIQHEQREQMLGTERAVGLRLETAIEVTAVEEPRERVGLGEPLKRLAVLLLHQHRADVPREELERDEVGLVERTSIEAVRDAEHAARFIVDDDRHAHERVGTVAPLTGLDRRARDIAYKERTLRLGDETNNSHAWLHAHLSLHIVREA